MEFKSTTLDKLLLKLAQRPWKRDNSIAGDIYRKITSGKFGIYWNLRTVVIKYEFEDIYVGHCMESLDIYQKISEFVATTWKNIEEADKRREKADQDAARQKALEELGL